MRRLTPEAVTAKWRRAVLERHGERCVGCGAREHLSVELVVPEDAGGKQTIENGTVVCRGCLFTRAARAHKRQETTDTVVNFYISAEMYDRIYQHLDTHREFSSFGKLLRFLMQQYVDDTSRALYGDLRVDARVSSPMDAKVNAWVASDLHERFKALVKERGQTVTDTARALLVLYLEILEGRTTND